MFAGKVGKERENIRMIKKDKYQKYYYWFDSSARKEDLKSKSIKGGISTTANQLISFGINLISTFVLARILLPSDFGLIGMVTAFTGFAEIIKDMGLSMAVVQKENITHKQVSNLFWINVGICFIIALIFILLSPVIVALYHDDNRIYYIIFSYAAGITISGLSIQHIALLSRRMLFSRITKGNILATIFSVWCGICAGLLGMGYWSIVILNISQITFNTCSMWVLCNWRPSFPARKQKIKGFLHFGAAVSGFNIFNYLARNSDNILIGRFIGAAAVGLYAKAYQLLMLPINQIRNPLMTVAIPAMSALKSEPRRYLSYYRKYVFLLAFFSMPLVACLAIFSKELIIIILGHNWIEASPIFQVLAIAGFIEPVASSAGLVMISEGHTKKYFLIGCIGSVITVLGFIVGIHWGVIGTAISFTLTAYIILVPTLLYAFNGTPVKISMFFQEIVLPIIHTAVMCGLLVIVKGLLIHIFPPIFVFLIIAPLGALFYYFSWKIYPLGRRKFDDIQELKLSVIKRFPIGNMPLYKRFHKMSYMSNSNKS